MTTAPCRPGQNVNCKWIEKLSIIFCILPLTGRTIHNGEKGIYAALYVHSDKKFPILGEGVDEGDLWLASLNNNKSMKCIHTNANFLHTSKNI
jgi:hypothetical protein